MHPADIGGRLRRRLLDGDPDEGQAAIRGGRRRRCLDFPAVARLCRGRGHDGNGSVSAGVTDANNIFDGNMTNGRRLPESWSRTSHRHQDRPQADRHRHLHRQCPDHLHEGRSDSRSFHGDAAVRARPPRCRPISISIWRWTCRARWACRRRRPKPCGCRRSTRTTIVQYPTGCTLACHFAPQNSACTDPGRHRPSPRRTAICTSYAIYTRGTIPICSHELMRISASSHKHAVHEHRTCRLRCSPT